MGKLILVATPIGNLEDLSPRAVSTFLKADLVLAEDTRRSGLLLSQLKISRPLLSLHEHNELGRIPEVLKKLHEDKTVALVSDAGTPTLSDPGFKLVREAIKAGFRIEVVPGPSAALTALVGSGLPTDRFIFVGYLPKTAGKAEKLLLSSKKALEALPATLILFESPHRLLKTLEKLQKFFPGCQLVLARELTKLHEEFIRGSVEEVTDKIGAQRIRGEFTLVLREQVPPGHT